MADISKIKALNGTTYNLKDATARANLTNAKITIAGNNVLLNSSLDAETLRISLELSNTMRFIGATTISIIDGSTTDPSINGYDFVNNKTPGDIIIDRNTSNVYAWSNTGKWNYLGPVAITIANFNIDSNGYLFLS